MTMEAESASKTSINFYQTTRRNIPEDSHLQFKVWSENREEENNLGEL
jgi:hypothetical protein